MNLRHGTGKTVIAIQLLAECLRLGYAAAHSTGGKAFTTVLKSRFPNAPELFIGNITVRRMPESGLDLLLVDEAHRVRKTSDTRFTAAAERNKRSQIEELLSAAKVTVFLLDENQYMRPDEIGSTQVIREGAHELGVELKEYDLTTQFRCGGCVEYIDWVDNILGFKEIQPKAWDASFKVRIVDSPEELELSIEKARGRSETGRLVAGFCWKWNDSNPDNSLVPDVSIGSWSRPWNRKALNRKTYRPNNHPYTIWAETPEGEGQIGCIYSVQGFEFDSVGVIWGGDLVRRGNEWVAVRENSFDRPVKAKNADTPRLLRNAYRVLLTRGMREVNLLVLDKETKVFLKECLEGIPY